MGIKITAATYGTINAGNDVTDIVQNIVDTGQDDILISNGNLGGDPDVGKTKSFGVIYTYKDQTLVRGGKEDETVDLAT